MLAKDVSWTEHCRTVGYPRAKYSDSDMGIVCVCHCSLLGR